MPTEIKDYVPNSDKHKTSAVPNKNINYAKPTLNGHISVRKNNEIEDKAIERANKIKKHAVEDVLLPGLKDAAWDIFTNALNEILYGGSRQMNNRGSIQRNNEVPFTSSIQYSSTNRYNRMSSPRYASRRESISTVRPRPENDLGVFTDKNDAYTVLDAMREIVATDGVVTVQTLFDICDQTAPYTATRFGWMDLEDARVDRVRDGWVLSFPRSMPLEQ